jgi:hypothetical protein
VRVLVKEVTGRDVIAIIDYWVDSGQMLDTYYVFLAEELISMVSE